MRGSLRPGEASTRMYTATLTCGSVLTFEFGSHLPARRESVPCRRHGYCDVDHVGKRAGTRSVRARRPRAKPGAQGELLEWLRGRSTTSIHALRRQRFTLRMVAAAERECLVAVDHDTGRVTVLRSAGTRRGRPFDNPREGGVPPRRFSGWTRVVVQLWLQLTPFAVVRGCLPQFERTGQCRYGTAANWHERDHAGLAVRGSGPCLFGFG